MLTTLTAQIVRFARPNIQIYDAHVVDLYQWVGARYLVGVKGADTTAKRDFNSALDRISERIALTSNPKVRPGGQLSKSTLYISIGYGGDGVSQSPLKDKVFSTFPDQNPPFGPRPGNGILLQSPYRPMARHRRQCHQATGERQIAVAPLSLIAVQSQNLMVAHPVLAQPFNFRRRSTS